MSATRLWRRVIESGVTEDTSPFETRSIVVGNAIAIVGAVVSLAFCAGIALSGAPGALNPGFTGLLLLGSVALNHAGRYSSAQLLLLASTLAAIVVQLFTIGNSSGLALFLLPACTVPFVVFSDRSSGLASVCALAISATFVASMAAGPVLPADGTSLGPPMYFLGALASAVLTLFIGYYARVVAITAETALHDEQRVADEILGNVLPSHIAARLRAGEPTVPEIHVDITVVHADIVGFTRLSEQLAPEMLVALLDEITSTFDDLCDRHGLEKLRTVGDAYIAASGIPFAREDHAIAALGLARDMLTALRARHEQLGVAIQVRIGVASGAAVAGIIGKRKPSYEVWGEALTVAAHMEAHGVAGRIVVAEATRRRLPAELACEPGPVVAVRGYGEVKGHILAVDASGP